MFAMPALVISCTISVRLYNLNPVPLCVVTIVLDANTLFGFAIRCVATLSMYCPALRAVVVSVASCVGILSVII